MRTGILLIFAAAAAWQDWRRREISWWVFGCFGAISVFLFLTEFAAGRPWTGYLTGTLPGFFLLLCGRLTGGGVGAGDGVFFVISGLLTGAEENLVLFLGSVFLCGMFGMVWYVRSLFRSRLSGNEELPFLPFCAMALLGRQALRLGPGI